MSGPGRTPEPAFDELALRAARERGVGVPVIRLLARPPGRSDEAAVDAVLAAPPPVDDHAPPGRSTEFLTPPDGPAVAELDEIDAAGARRALAYVLAHELAFDHDTGMPPARAEELAAAFVATLRDPSRWWTNNDGTHRTPPRWAAWNPLTTATFDTGVIGVDDRSVLVVWFMEED